MPQHILWPLEPLLLYLTPYFVLRKGNKCLCSTGDSQQGTLVVWSTFFQSILLYAAGGNKLTGKTQTNNQLSIMALCALISLHTIVLQHERPTEHGPRDNPTLKAIRYDEPKAVQLG